MRFNFYGCGFSVWGMTWLCWSNTFNCFWGDPSQHLQRPTWLGMCGSVFALRSMSRKRTRVVQGGGSRAFETRNGKHSSMRCYLTDLIVETTIPKRCRRNEKCKPGGDLGSWGNWWVECFGLDDLVPLVRRPSDTFYSTYRRLQVSEFQNLFIKGRWI